MQLTHLCPKVIFNILELIFVLIRTITHRLWN